MMTVNLVMNHFETKEFCNLKRRRLREDEINEIARIAGCIIFLAEYMKDNYQQLGIESPTVALQNLNADLTKSAVTIDFEQSVHSIVGAFLPAEQIEAKIAEKAAMKKADIGDLSLAIDFQSTKSTLYFILELSVLDTGDNKNRLWPQLHRFFKCSFCESIHHYPDGLWIEI